MDQSKTGGEGRLGVGSSQMESLAWPWKQAPHLCGNRVALGYTFDLTSRYSQK